ncbi:MAG: Glu-tRNA(Gln) amidotransferase GatDE subunit D, partial [Methanosarcinales archaeon]
FVIEGTGMGHVPTQTEKSWIKNIKRIAKNYPVVIVPQTLFGRINRNVYANLRTLYYEANAIPGEDMIPEVAYIKLGWLLGHKYSLEKIRELMVTSIVGEITERSLV